MASNLFNIIDESIVNYLKPASHLFFVAKRRAVWALRWMAELTVAEKASFYQ